MKYDDKIEDPYDDPYDELLKDVLIGRADLKMVIWFKNREILEKELNYPKKTYKELYDEFITKEIRKICLRNSCINLFKDYNRCDDFFESVQKSMGFYKKYRVIKNKHELIYQRINLFISLGLISGHQFILCLIK